MGKWKEDIEKRVGKLESKGLVYDVRHMIGAFHINKATGFAKKMIEIRKEYEDQMEKLKAIACSEPINVRSNMCGAAFACEKPLFCCSTNKTAAEMDQLLKDVKENPNVKEALNSELPDKVQIYDLQREVKNLEKENLKLLKKYDALDSKTKALVKEYSYLDCRKNSYMERIEKLNVENKNLRRITPDYIKYGKLDLTQDNIKEDEAYNQAINDVQDRLNKNTYLGAGICDMIEGLKKK